MAALVFSGCTRTDGAFDLSDVPDGTYGEAYSGQVQVTDYSGPARFTLVSGELPPGLDMDEGGNITGTPTYGMQVELTVLSQDMTQVEDFQDVVSFRIDAEGVEGAFLGYEHDQINNMTGFDGWMRDFWLRASGGGVEGLDSWSINPGVYLPGPNGIAERGQSDGLEDGLYDDVRIGDVAFSDLEVDFSGWEPTEELFTDPPSYPSQHLPEDDPPSVDSSTGVITAGAAGGAAALTLTHPPRGEVEPRGKVVPPGWCPQGTFGPDGGGPGEGYCA